jgi:hypothetical protein
MPMPALDPIRHPHVVLGNPEHRLPMPGTNMFFPPEGRRVDAHDPFWASLIADRSLVRSPPAEPPAAPEPGPER